MILNLKLEIQQIIIGVYEITNQLAFSNFPLKCGCCFFVSAIKTVPLEVFT